MANPVQITQDSDGTFIVSEPGQSPQKLTRNWKDLDGFLKGQFRVFADEPHQGAAFDNDKVSYPGNTEHPSNKPKGNQSVPDEADTTPTKRAHKAA